MVKENTDWLESEEREAQKEILESHKEPSDTTSGGGPAVPSSTAKRAPNGRVSGFRGSQKDNGHPPNGGPGGSARRFRPAAPPRPPSAAHLRSAPRAPRLAGKGARGEMRARGHSPLRPARLCSPGPAPSPPPSPARSQAPRANAARREKGGTGVSRQSRLYWAPGPPRARRPLPRASSSRPPVCLPAPARAAGPALPRRPPPPRRRGPRTAHRLPRRRLQRRRPAPECGPGPGRRVSLLWHRGGREPRDSQRRAVAAR